MKEDRGLSDEIAGDEDDIFDVSFLKAVIESAMNRGTEVFIVQLPEGLRRITYRIKAVADELFNQTKERRKNHLLFFDASPCFGACHLPSIPSFLSTEETTRNLLVIQFGHLPVPEIYCCPPVTSSSEPCMTILSCKEDRNIPVVFVPVYCKINLPGSGVVKQIRDIVEDREFLLLASYPYTEILEPLSLLLRTAELKPVISTGHARIYTAGQVLGCNFSAIGCSSMRDENRVVENRVNEKKASKNVLVISDGMFHPLGASLTGVSCKVWWIDPQSWAITDMAPERDRFLRKRFGKIEYCREKGFKKCGILLSTAIGQERISLAKKISIQAEQHGFSPVIFTDNLFDFTTLSYMPVNFFVSTACPRIAIDDAERIKKPVLTPIEFEILCGIGQWDDYVLDQILEGGQR
ncbi:MAG: diphthamide synthesis protein [Thermoplasmata archaeon]